MANNLGILDWDGICNYIQRLPYGRNSDRSDLTLVLSEKKGSCSSKHACLKQIAIENNLDEVELILAIYKMNQLNTPGIGAFRKTLGLQYIPEAHCYLRINGNRYDFTSINASFDRIENDIIEEQIIQPEQVNQYKLDYHQEFIRKWLDEFHPDLQFEEIWAARENCISNLSKLPNSF